MVSHILWHTFSNNITPSITPLRPEINQPITGSNHIQIVLNHNHGMPAFKQLAQRAHEFGDVIKVKARCRLIEQKQRTLFGHRLLAGSGRLRSPRQEPS